MGALRFIVPQPQHLSDDRLKRAYLSGLDDVPLMCRIGWSSEDSSILVAEHEEQHTCRIHMPWSVPGHGELLLSSASLVECDRPYHLSVELARGTVNRLRNQSAEWQPRGLDVLPDATEALASATRLLARAAVSRRDPAQAEQWAEEAIASGLNAMLLFGETYFQHALNMRRALSPRPAVAGVNLGTTLLQKAVRDEVVESFNAAMVPLAWRQLEPREGEMDWKLADQQMKWCASKDLDIYSGPLLQLDQEFLPDWVIAQGEQLGNLAANFIRRVVNRYHGHVQVWQCAARMNVADGHGLSEEQRLRMAVLALETTRSVAPEAEVVLVLDQPWGEFMRHQCCDLAPLYFADAFTRADVGLSGIGLEINLGYHPEGTHQRDLMEISRQIDRFSAFGLPLLVSLVIPSGSHSDPRATVASSALPFAEGEAASTKTQCRWLRQLLPMLLAKESVQSVIWRQLLDSKPHEYAHGGLFDPSNNAKPALAVFRQYRH